ncbi:RING-H2 finger protein ATL46 [Camellia lanceoleosa]|uniref:RING-H2 finger protein ATL46 n=1 Tax=Camellia lanceoleosa TaxID=1840588 RepID=A0ACC0GT95_9ERIC|nr:RING-H2 finger protein ATL46 [Camellia lanceoleosa]
MNVDLLGTFFTPGLSIENPIFGFDDFREDDGLPNNRHNGFVSNKKTIEIEEMVSEKGVFLVRLGKFRKLDDGAGETVEGETSSCNLDARICYSMGSYQYVVGGTNVKVALSHDRNGDDMKIVNGIEQNGNRKPIVDGDMKGKKISIGSKTDSYSVFKIWLWSKKGKFASSSKTQ